MKKPWVFAIGFGVGILCIMAWSLTSKMVPPSGDMVQNALEPDRQKAEGNILRELAVMALKGQSKEDVLTKIGAFNADFTVKDQSNDMIYLENTPLGQIAIVFENDQLVWITNHCERNAANPVTCRPTGAN